MTTDAKKQERLREFVNQEVYANQTPLVEAILANGLVDYSEIENYFDSEGEEAESEPKEIFEWWLVSDRLRQLLKDKNEPILESDYESWWGRTTTGQAILLDAVIEEIYDDLGWD